MEYIIYQIGKSNMESLGNIRHLEGISIAAYNDAYLVKIPEKISDNPLFRTLPVNAKYSIDEQQRLFKYGEQVPVGKLNDLVFVTLKGFIVPEAPVSALPGKYGSRLPITITASREPQKSFALLADLKDWKHYGEDTAATRLSTLSFAVSANAKVLIIGEPLPPLPGKELWIDQQILIPSGYTLSPAYAAEYISHKIDPQKKFFILFCEDNTWSKIDRSFFVPASRSAIRLTSVPKFETIVGNER